MTPTTLSHLTGRLHKVVPPSCRFGAFLDPGATTSGTGHDILSSLVPVVLLVSWFSCCFSSASLTSLKKVILTPHLQCCCFQVSHMALPIAPSSLPSRFLWRASCFNLIPALSSVLMIHSSAFLFLDCLLSKMKSQLIFPSSISSVYPQAQAQHD